MKRRERVFVPRSTWNSGKGSLLAYPLTESILQDYLFLCLRKDNFGAILYINL